MQRARLLLAVPVACACACGDATQPAPRPVVLVLTASDTIQVTGATLSFSAAALDSTGAAVPNVAVAWAVSDPRRGQITTGGVFTALDSGSTWVRAVVATPPLAESVPVRVVAPGTVKWTWAATEAGGVLPTMGGSALGTDGTVYVVVIRNPQPPDLAALVALGPGGLPTWIVPLDWVGTNYPVVTPAGVLVTGKQVHLVRGDGTIAWQALMEANTPSFKSAAITDALAFVVHGYHLTTLTLATGDTLWQSARAPLSSWLVPPTIVGSDVVYAKHSSDTLFEFRQSDGTILKTFLDPDTGRDKRVFGAGTVPVGSRIYLPTWNRLAAFDTAGPLMWLTDWTGQGDRKSVV